jgi:hypothetical protein
MLKTASVQTTHRSWRLTSADAVVRLLAEFNESESKAVSAYQAALVYQLDRSNSNVMNLYLG